MAPVQARNQDFVYCYGPSSHCRYSYGLYSYGLYIIMAPVQARNRDSGQVVPRVIFGELGQGVKETAALTAF